MAFDEQEVALRRFDEARAQFIETEIELGLTFCGVARVTSSEETRERNLQNAQKASDTAGENLQKATLTAAEKDRLRGRLAELNELLGNENRS